MGDADKLKKGQFVIAVANPFAAGFRDGSPSVSCQRRSSATSVFIATPCASAGGATLCSSCQIQ